MSSEKEKAWLEDIEFSDPFCRFIKSAIPEMEAAELLLLFQNRPDASYSTDEAVAKLGPGIAVSKMADYLRVFQSIGVLQFAEGRFRYNPESEHGAAVSVLEKAYSQRPVTLLRIIYALRDSKIQSFADAFKLRKP
jgi:hypothetical protein